MPHPRDEDDHAGHLPVVSGPGGAPVIILTNPPSASGPSGPVTVSRRDALAVAAGPRDVRYVAVVPAGMSPGDVASFLRRAVAAMSPAHVAAATAVPLVDAVKRIADGVVVDDVDRTTLRRLTSPAVFTVEWARGLVDRSDPVHIRPLTAAVAQGLVAVLD